MKKCNCAASVIVLILLSTQLSSAEMVPENFLFGISPNSDAREALSGLEVTRPTSDIDPSDIQSLIVPADPEAGAGNEETVEIPFAVPNTMILTLRPDITDEELGRLIAERNLTVVDAFPNLNAIQAQTDLTQFFVMNIGDNSVNDALLRGSILAAESFKAENSIIGATPDFIYEPMSSNAESITSALPSQRQLPQVETFVDVSADEDIDWGIGDIQADMLWNEPEAHDGALMGVMDVGFGRHEDLIFLAVDPNNPPHNHGNHVAGIACGDHNGVGIRGVVPNCMVLSRSGDFFPILNEGGNPIRFMTRFSMIMRTLDSFVAESSQVRVYNISLGYNWIPNFGINIDGDQAASYRQLVAMQGENLLNALVRADERGAIIASAAGNDSSGFSIPIRAEFSSPFNWAATAARERGLASNTLVVEAHDQMGRRAQFSNVDGNISCPGVNILSTVAVDSSGRPTMDAYGTMSGTSMASPYCAGGALLMTLIRPNYTGSEIVECMENSSAYSSSGTPMLRLAQAIAVCPRKS